MRRRSLFRMAGAALLGLSGCAAQPRTHAPDEVAAAADYILLGEVHDNAEGHRKRLEWLRSLAPGPRRALVLEQFDLDSQPAIARWRSEHPAARGAEAAAALARAGAFGQTAWHYPFYEPVIALALEQGWDLRAGNLSRQDAMRIARDPARATPAPAGWSQPAEAALEAAVFDGHCGILAPARVRAMALAQRSRDAAMAGAMRAARADGFGQVILLAGNGHVQRRFGVPLHLHGAEPAARIHAVGFIERGGPLDAADFDAIRRLAPVVREDPCIALRRPSG